MSKKQELEEEIKFYRECLLDMASEHIEDCEKLYKKLDNWRIAASKKDLKIIRQKEEITLLLKQKKELNFKYLGFKGIAEMHERHMNIQDSAIARKDEQMEALKKLYRDDLINGRI